MGPGPLWLVWAIGVLAAHAGEPVRAPDEAAWAELERRVAEMEIPPPDWDGGGWLIRPENTWDREPFGPRPRGMQAFAREPGVVFFAPIPQPTAVSFEVVRAVGAVDPGALGDALARLGSAVRWCYDREPGPRPDGTSRVELALRFGADGTVDHLTVIASDLPDPRTACVERGMRRVAIPAPGGPGAVARVALTITPDP